MTAGDPTLLRLSERDVPHLRRAVHYTRGRRRAVVAGGGVGVFPLYLSGVFERVDTFEPDTKNCDALTTNCRLVVGEVLRIYPWALGERRGTAAMSHRSRSSSKKFNAGMSHLAEGSGVRVVPLDELGFEDLDLLVLDVEGYELRALRGVEQTLERCRPVVMVEVNQWISHYGDSAEQLREWMMVRGYWLAEQHGSDDVWVPR